MLQVDKSDGGVRLSCRWLDDLTRATDTMIRECDQAFDKAKHQAARFAKMKKSGNTKKIEPVKSNNQKVEAVQKKQKLSVTLDADETRHSHILILKQHFRDHRGKIPVQVDFSCSERTIAALHIDTNWGVDLSNEFQEKIRSIPTIINFNIYEE